MAPCSAVIAFVNAPCVALSARRSSAEPLSANPAPPTWARCVPRVLNIVRVSCSCLIAVACFTISAFWRAMAAASSYEPAEAVAPFAPNRSETAPPKSVKAWATSEEAEATSALYLFHEASDRAHRRRIGPADLPGHHRLEIVGVFKAIPVHPAEQLERSVRLTGAGLELRRVQLRKISAKGNALRTRKQRPELENTAWLGKPRPRRAAALLLRVRAHELALRDIAITHHAGHRVDRVCLLDLRR